MNNLRAGNGIQFLDANNNKITDISGVSNTPKLNTLLLSNNNIKQNLTPLKSLTKLRKLYISNNNITDISAIKDLNLSKLVCSNNYISDDNLSMYATDVTALNNTSTKTTNNDGTIEIPKEVKDAINLGNDNVEFVNCALKNQKISLNEGEIKGKVIIKSGKFSDSIININAPTDNTPPVINVSYRENKETNQIEAVITSNEELGDLPFFKRSEDKKTLVKSYGYNTSELLEVSDLAGNKTPIQINITQFDNNRIPGFTVRVNNSNFENNVTNENVIVTISADVPLHKPDYGDYWTISNDGKTLTKSFDTKTVLYQTIYSQADYELDRELRPRYLNGETELLGQLREIEARRIDVRLEIPNIDKDAPECNVEYSKTEKTRGCVRATIWSNEKIKLFNDKGFDVTETTKLDDNGNTLYGLTLFYNENGTETFLVEDLAHNPTPVEISVNNIDNKIDGLTSKQNNSIISNKNVSVSIMANENIGLVNQNVLQGKTKLEFAKLFADNNQSNSKQQIKYDLEENDTDTLDVIDDAGNIDTILYAVNSIDKTAPVVLRENDVFNNDGSKTIIYWVNERLANMEELSGWTYDEQTSTISKTFNTNTTELLKVKDLAGNESEEEVSVENVNKVKYEVSFVYYQKLNQYLVKITADTKLQKVDGWDISEDGKVLSKYMNPDEGEILYIEDYEGNGSEVRIKLPDTTLENQISIEDEKTTKDETPTEDTTSENEVSTDDKTPTEDIKLANKSIPQTGTNSLITAAIIFILIGLTFVAYRNYMKNKY